MNGTTKPGTIQMRVTADKDRTEAFARQLSSYLQILGYDVIDTSPDYPDRFDAERRKFHMVAVLRSGSEIPADVSLCTCGAVITSTQAEGSGLCEECEAKGEK